MCSGHYKLEGSNVLSQTAVRESTSTLSQLETIQIALLLSFCARRHDGIPVPENRDWFHVALSKLQSLQKETPVQEMTSHFKRIWWTCFLYERLDAFGPASPVESSEFILNSEDVPPLTLRDFEIDSCYVSWVIGKSEGSRMDMIVKDLRLASIYLQKVWLAEQVDIAIQNNQNFTSRCSVSESPVESTLSAIICDQQFWNAYEVQRQFNTWQKETGNNTIMINEHVRECPCFIVHWTSLSLLYYRIVIALYNSALWAYKKHSSKIDTVKHLLGRERTTYFYSCIMEQTQSVLSQHQAAVAHATDPSIWTSLVTIAGAIKSTQQDRHGPGQSSTALAYEAMSHKSRKIVTAFNSHLTQWKSAPHPISNELPELFMLPGSPRFTPAQALQTFENLRELGAIDEHECKFSIDKRSRKIIQPTHISMTAINYVARNSDMLDASHIIHNLEGLVYGSIM